MAERTSEANQHPEGNRSARFVPPRVQTRSGQDEISLLEVLSVMLRRRTTIIRSVVLVTLGALILALLSATTFTASTSFVPQGAGEGGGISRIASLAGQFGFQLPSGSLGESPEFYAQLVTSRGILRILATEEFRFDEPGDGELASVTGTLPDLLELETREEDPAVRREAAIKWLRGAVSVATGRETGIVRVSIQTPWAGLSRTLADRILELVNEFNLQTRQSQGAAERRFVEDRLLESRDSLRAAEDRLEAFLKSNRQWTASPELSFEHERLQRQVSMQQQVYTSLAEFYEQARIAEVRNTPVITVVETPELPVRADPRRRVLKLALGVVLGGMVGGMLALVQEYMQRAREDDEEVYQAFSSLRARAWADLRSLGGVIGRSRPASQP